MQCMIQYLIIITLPAQQSAFLIVTLTELWSLWLLLLLLPGVGLLSGMDC